MKRILALCMVVLCLLTCVTAFAQEEETTSAYTEAWAQAQMKGYLDTDNQNPLTLTITQDTDNHDVLCGVYYPSNAIFYLMDNPYFNFTNENAVQRMIFDIKIDDSKWLSEFDEIYGPMALATNIPETTLSDRPTEMEVLKTYIPMEENVGGPLSEYFTYADGAYTLDLSQHTIYVRYRCTLVHDGMLFEFSPSPEASITLYTKDNMPTELPNPVITHAVASIDDKKVTYKIADDGVLNSLMVQGQTFNVVSTIYINDTEYGTNTQTYGSNAYFECSLTDDVTLTATDSVKITVKFVNPDTQVSSATTTASAELQVQSDDVVPEYPVEDSSSPTTPIIETKQCKLCHACPAQPLGMCLWIVIAGGVMLCVVIVSGILLVVDKSKSNKKEKPNA